MRKATLFGQHHSHEAEITLVIESPVNAKISKSRKFLIYVSKTENEVELSDSKEALTTELNFSVRLTGNELIAMAIALEKDEYEVSIMLGGPGPRKEPSLA